MKKFENFEELLKEIGAECTSDFVYGKKELNNFLACTGSDEGKEPYFSFLVEFNGLKYKLGVTHEEIAEDEYKYTYWLMDIENLEGKLWKDVKAILDNQSTVDMSNFDNESGIVDFKGIYSDFSVTGYIVNLNEEIEIKIKDDAVIYRNN